MMKYLYIVFLLAVGLLGSSVASADTGSVNATQIQALQQQLSQLQEMLANISKGSSNSPSTKKVLPNLVVSQVSIDKDALGGNSLGQPLPDQEIVVTVSNDTAGYINSTSQKADCAVVVIEKVAGPDKVTKIKSTAEFVIPDGGKSVTFNVLVEGGVVFSNQKYERTFYPRVSVDTKKKIKEKNERDNVMNAIGTAWVMEYYKG